MSSRGPLAPDGSPVELYRRLAAGAEPDIIHRALPRGCAILELGCGAGRVTRRLVEIGHPVVAVDHSAEMLQHVTGAETVLSDIETLALGRRFPGVLLASQLVNTADRARRQAFLRTCGRHVEPGGTVLIQRLDPGRVWAVGDAGESSLGNARIRLRIHERRAEVIRARAEYELDELCWTQEFEAEILDDDACAAALAEAGLRFAGTLEGLPTWLVALP